MPESVVWSPDEIAASRNVLFMPRKLIFILPKYSSAGAEFLNFSCCACCHFVSGGAGGVAAEAAMAVTPSATNNPAIGDCTDAVFL